MDVTDQTLCAVLVRIVGCEIKLVYPVVRDIGGGRVGEGSLISVLAAHVRQRQVQVQVSKVQMTKSSNVSNNGIVKSQLFCILHTYQRHIQCSSSEQQYVWSFHRGQQSYQGHARSLEGQEP